ncbi:glycosylphosphatidylinositol anchor attachment 1 protein [Helicoverpa armigera]|uniref:glycosylphosphatidylinositol anchor attachment 1 protein n=1 Tax=Helicoverpa armigera TaxID=29058 RepID=UPI003083C2D1
MNSTLVQILVAFLLSVPSFMIAIGNTWTSYALLMLESEDSPIGYRITKNDGNLISSIIMLGSLSAILVVGYIADKIGRKRTAILSGLCYALSWSIIATAKSVTQILIGRFVIGMGTGLHIVTGVVYVGEISQTSIRGSLLTMMTFMYNVGTLISYLEGWFCSYQVINYLNLSIAVGYILLLFILKETPVYLLRMGREKDAIKSLKFYRGESTVTQEILDEIVYLKSQLSSDNENNIEDTDINSAVLEKEKLNQENETANDGITEQKSAWSILRTTKSAQRALVLLVIGMDLSVCMGMIAVQAYAGQFFAQAAPSISPHLCSVILAIVVCFVSGLSVFLVDLIPRRDKYDDLDEMPVPWLVAKMSQLHLEVYTHNFTLNYPLGQGQVYKGTNVYGILRAPRTSSLEAIVVTAPYRSLSTHQKGTAAGIALMLAFAKFARPQKYWAKDIIFLVTEHEQLGMQAWLEAYHGLQSEAETFHTSLGSFWKPGTPSLDFGRYLSGFDWTGDHKRCLNPGKLKGRSGSIQAAINLEFATPKIKYIEVKVEGLNGQLPNLDLVNLVHKLCLKSGIHHSFRNSYSWMRGRNKMDDWMNSFRTMFDMVITQIDGVPDGNHGLFHRFGIEAVTLEGREANDPAGTAPRAQALSTANFYRLGVALESILRSLNNLLERFHQSYFFYLLAATHRFISIGQYMPSLCLLCVAMLIRALSLWVSIQQDGDEETDKSANKKTSKQKQNKEKDSDTELPGDDEVKEVKKVRKPKKAAKDDLSMSVVNIGANYLLVHLIGYAVMNCPLILTQIGAHYYDKPSEVSVFYGLIAVSVLLTIITPFMPRLLRKGRITYEELSLVNILLLIELSTVCLSVGMHNFSLGFVIAVVYTPMALMCSVVVNGAGKASTFYLMIKRIICLLVHPLAAVSICMIGYSKVLFPEEAFFDMLARGSDAAMQALMFSIVDSMLYGNWLFNLASAVILPIWIIFWQILSIKVNAPA